MTLILFGVVCAVCAVVGFFVIEWIEERAFAAFQRRKLRG